MADYFLTTRRAKMGVTPRFRTPTIPQVTLPTTPTIPRALPTIPRATAIPKATAVTPTATPELSISDILGLQKPGMFETIAGAIPEYEAPTPPSGWHPLAQMAYMGEAAPSGWETGLRTLAGSLALSSALQRKKKMVDILNEMLKKGEWEITGFDAEGNIKIGKRAKTITETLKELPEELRGGIFPKGITAEGAVTYGITTPEQKAATELAERQRIARQVAPEALSRAKNIITALQKYRTAGIPIPQLGLEKEQEIRGIYETIAPETRGILTTAEQARYPAWSELVRELRPKLPDKTAFTRTMDFNRDVQAGIDAIKKGADPDKVFDRILEVYPDKVNTIENLRFKYGGKI